MQAKERDIGRRIDRDGYKSRGRDRNRWRQRQRWRLRDGDGDGVKDEDGEIDGGRCRHNCAWEDNESCPEPLCFVIWCGSFLGVILENTTETS